MIISILILTIEQRYFMLNELMFELSKQVREAGLTFDDIQILKDSRSPEVSKGEKRNALLQAAEGEYVCFVDDDDWVSENYIQTIVNHLKEKPDCLSLRGIMTTDGENPELFEHSLRYSHWFQNDNAGPSEIKYYRNPNHLNVIRADIAKQIKFPEKDFGEDHEWSKQLQASGLLKNESYIDQVLYHYKYISKK